MEFFDLLNNLYHKRFNYPEEADINKNIWMINRWVSMDKDLLTYVAELSKYLFVLGDRYYKLLYRLIPMSVSQRNKYVKPVNDIDSRLISRYSEFFGVGNRETKDYLKILSKQYKDNELYEFVGLEYKES